MRRQATTTRGLGTAPLSLPPPPQQQTQMTRGNTCEAKPAAGVSPASYPGCATHAAQRYPPCGRRCTTQRGTFACPIPALTSQAAAPPLPLFPARSRPPAHCVCTVPSRRPHLSQLRRLTTSAKNSPHPPPLSPSSSHRRGIAPPCTSVEAGWCVQTAPCSTRACHTEAGTGPPPQRHTAP